MGGKLLVGVEGADAQQARAAGAPTRAKPKVPVKLIARRSTDSLKRAS